MFARATKKIEKRGEKSDASGTSKYSIVDGKRNGNTKTQTIDVVFGIFFSLFFLVQYFCQMPLQCFREYLFWTFANGSMDWLSKFDALAMHSSRSRSLYALRSTHPKAFSGRIPKISDSSVAVLSSFHSTLFHLSPALCPLIITEEHFYRSNGNSMRDEFDEPSAIGVWLILRLRRSNCYPLYVIRTVGM